VQMRPLEQVLSYFITKSIFLQANEKQFFTGL